MWNFERFRDRFALGIGLYIGSWGTHFYLSFWEFELSFESGRVKPAEDPVSD